MSRPDTMKVCFLTLGCKLNQYDAERLKEIHIKKGDIIVSIDEKPDIIYVNTCSVTSLAGHQSRNLFRRAKKITDKVLVLGCHAKLFPEEFDGAEFYNSEDNGINVFQERMRAYLKIQEGCNNFCSYCIVPYARGENRSVPPDRILEELEKKIDSGYCEIILTGTHIGNYYYDGIKLKDVVEMILKRKVHLRLSSLSPSEIDDSFIHLFEYENLAPHIHISQQSGDNKILKLMRRKYTREDTIKIVEKIRKVREDVNIGADFIVGFPYEDDNAFQNSLKLIEEANFTYLHIFRYSPRPFTLAKLFEDNVSDKKKIERSKVMKEFGDKNNYRFREKMLGKVYKVFPVRKFDKQDKMYYGFTPNYIRVLFSKEPFYEPTYVRITKITMDRTYGEKA